MALVDYLELKFQHALLTAGAFLAALGLVAALLTTPSQLQASDSLLDALSYGFTAIFFALFSGVLIGVGTALMSASLVLRLRGEITHIIMSFLLSVLSMLIAVAAIVSAGASTYPTMVLFFAGLASAGAFLMCTVAFALSGAVKSYLDHYKTRDRL